jgi:cytochrome c oxidase subunit 3
MIPPIWRQLTRNRSNHHRINCNSMMTWRDTRRDISRIAYKDSNKGLRRGIILFIVSEILFFVSFFWAFFHSRLSPTIELGSNWPPTGIQPFNPIKVPLLNTAILLASGVTVTWAHHGLLENNATQATQGLFFTVLLGIYFNALQAYEYFDAPFTIADSAYGPTFLVAKGFHESNHWNQRQFHHHFYLIRKVHFPFRKCQLINN